MNEDSIEAVLKMLELEGRVERREYNEPDGLIYRYRLHMSKSDRPEAAIPCVGCPVSCSKCENSRSLLNFSEDRTIFQVKTLCNMKSPINPMDCPHFENWLKNFNF